MVRSCARALLVVLALGVPAVVVAAAETAAAAEATDSQAPRIQWFGRFTLAMAIQGDGALFEPEVGWMQGPEGEPRWGGSVFADFVSGFTGPDYGGDLRFGGDGYRGDHRFGVKVRTVRPLSGDWDLELAGGLALSTEAEGALLAEAMIRRSAIGLGARVEMDAERGTPTVMGQASLSGGIVQSANTVALVGAAVVAFALIFIATHPITLN